MDLEIQYIFRFADGSESLFAIHLDKQRLEPLNPPADPPEWTRLGFHQCSNCPLNEEESPYCPQARALSVPVDQLSTVLSYDKVEVEVITPERHIRHRTSAQGGISAMMGLIIATSGCPRMNFLKPMARFHLPFATEIETIYRATSMYLLGQLLRSQRGLPAELDLSGLVSRYREVETVNRAMAQRLRAASQQDGTVNALILLDMFAKSMPFAVDQILPELETLYTDYLQMS